jgi:hypothetical protein
MFGEIFARDPSLPFDEPGFPSRFKKVHEFKKISL